MTTPQTKNTSVGVRGIRHPINPSSVVGNPSSVPAAAQQISFAALANALKPLILGGSKVIAIIKQVVFGANPTATAGATAINGTATTYMRSDAAPAVALGSPTTYGLVKYDNSKIVQNGSNQLTVNEAGLVLNLGLLPLCNGDLTISSPGVMTDGLGQTIGVKFGVIDPGADTTIKYRLRADTHANRPSTPNVVANESVVYWETDTGKLYMWGGSAWTELI